MPLYATIGVSTRCEAPRKVHLPDEEKDSLEDQCEDHELRLVVRLAARDRGVAVAREWVVIRIAEDEFGCEDDVNQECSYVPQRRY